jgi:hypothetical protein
VFKAAPRWVKVLRDETTADMQEARQEKKAEQAAEVDATRQRLVDLVKADPKLSVRTLAAKGARWQGTGECNRTPGRQGCVRHMRG